jgi:hypothetical protein
VRSSTPALRTRSVCTKKLSSVCTAQQTTGSTSGGYTEQVISSELAHVRRAPSMTVLLQQPGSYCKALQLPPPLYAACWSTISSHWCASGCACSWLGLHCPRRPCISTVFCLAGQPTVHTAHCCCCWSCAAAIVCIAADARAA